MTDETPVEESEDDPYESFHKALDAAREAVDKLHGKDKKEQPRSLKEAGEVARQVFAEHRKAAKTQSK